MIDQPPRQHGGCGFGTCDRGGRPQTQTQVGPPTMDAPLCSWRRTSISARQWPHWDPGSTTLKAQESCNSRQLAQAQTWTLLASQITPPRKHSPCSRARMQDPTGPGPGTRTGPGRTPGRTAAAAHHPRHCTGTTIGDPTRKLQTNVLT
jgi:hypothetical protein